MKDIRYAIYETIVQGIIRYISVCLDQPHLYLISDTYEKANKGIRELIRCHYDLDIKTTECPTGVNEKGEMYHGD